MNEKAITKFLAEAMGWEIKDRYRNLPHERPSPILWYWNSNVLIMEVKDFDPMHKIEHAFMVVEWMLPKELVTIRGWHWEHKEYEAVFTRGGLIHTAKADTAPQAICIAAARALATDAQLKGWGL